MAGQLLIPRSSDETIQRDTLSQLNPSNAYVFEEALRYNITEGFSGSAIQHMQMYDEYLNDNGVQLSVEELKEKYPDKLVNWDKPLTTGQAELIRERKLREVQYAELNERVQGMRNLTSFSASMIAGVMDPIGSITGLGFAPSQSLKALGPLRARLLASELAQGLGVQVTGKGAASAVGSAAALGAFDAAVGNLALEPLMFAMQQEMHSEYTLLDSMANVVFGAVFGGVVGASGQTGIMRNAAQGLHSVGDWIPSWLGGKKMDTHVSALQTAVGHVLEGKPPEIIPILRADANAQQRAGAPVNQADLAGPDVTTTTSETINTFESPLTSADEAMNLVEAEHKRVERGSTTDMPNEDFSEDIDALAKDLPMQNDVDMRQQTLVAEIEHEINMLRAETQTDVEFEAINKELNSELEMINKELSEVGNTQKAMYEAAACLMDL